MTLSGGGLPPALNVSRETLDALRSYGDMVLRWNPAVNLVARSTLSTLWDRHIVDSAQLFAMAPPEAAAWVDLGTGGGFPGMVVAIIAAELRPAMVVTMVESDLRKAAFLREAARQLSLTAPIIALRIEALPGQKADVLSARALAPLDRLLHFADDHLSSTGIALFMKGARHPEEIAEAKTQWSFEVEAIPSYCDPRAAILRVWNIERAINEK